MFRDRIDAGKKLATALAGYAGKKDALILALPRGGVPVAHEAAKALSLPLDIWLVRKLGIPDNEETAMGAISTGGVCYINRNTVAEFQIPEDQIRQIIEKEKLELQRRNNLYRHGRAPASVTEKMVLIIDDGLATGATMHAAIDSLRQAGAKYIVAAVPVGAESAITELTEIADKVVCPYVPAVFYGVGQWYKNFPQTTDKEVQEILKHYASL